MFGSSVINRLRSLDVYRKIPKDYTESTISGAMSNLTVKFVTRTSFDHLYDDYDNTFHF